MCDVYKAYKTAAEMSYVWLNSGAWNSVWVKYEMNSFQLNEHPQLPTNKTNDMSVGIILR